MSDEWEPASADAAVMAVPQAAPAAEEVGAGQATAFTVAYGGYDNYYRSDDVVAGRWHMCP